MQRLPGLRRLAAGSHVREEELQPQPGAFLEVEGLAGFVDAAGVFQAEAAGLIEPNLTHHRASGETLADSSRLLSSGTLVCYYRTNKGGERQWLE